MYKQSNHIVIMIIIMWIQEGHLSSNGQCFDIGMTIRKSLHTFERSNETKPFCGSTADNAAGNGSLMRLCPVPLAFHKHPLAALTMAEESSKTTHGAKAALDACRYTCNYMQCPVMLLYSSIMRA